MKIFGLACLAAVNPKLLAVDLILMANRAPPRALAGVVFLALEQKHVMTQEDE